MPLLKDPPLALPCCLEFFFFPPLKTIPLFL